MHRVCLSFWIAVLAFSSTALGSPVKTETVSYPSGGETVSGYLASPDSTSPHPALIVIHESWGLTDWVKEQAQKLAALGYVALAVDLYRGKVAYDPILAHEMARDLSPDQVVGDLRAAFDYLASRPGVRKDKIGAIGWCVGGSFALLLAMNEPKLAACIVNYGTPPTDKAGIRKIQAPVLGNFGAEDREVPPATAEAFENAMKAAHKSIDVKIYDRAGHGFENSDNHLGYQEEAAADAWARTMAFLDRTLKGQ